MKDKIVRKTIKLAGKDISVAVAPRPDTIRPTPVGVFKTLKSLLTGMKVTLKYFVNPKTVVTQQYPENRETLKMFDRFRSRLTMVYDEDGYHSCTGCRICEKACPNKSIIIDAKKGELTKKPETLSFLWRHDSCMFCSLCVFSCPFGSIEFDGEFETAVFDKRLLVYNLNRYAGAAGKVLKKLEASDPETFKTVKENMKTVPRFSKESPLGGTDLPGCSATKTYDQQNP